MSIKIKHKRSSAAGAKPTAAQLDNGEIAVNYSNADPALYVKDSTGTVVRIAGNGAVGVGGSETAPASPATGDVWVDTSSVPNVTKVWNGASWVSQAGVTVIAAVAPATPATGQTWVDTSVIPNLVKVWDGTGWVTTALVGAAGQALSNDAKYATKAEAQAEALSNDAKYATKTELQAEDLWDRAGTEISPKTAGDDVFTSGDVKVGGTTGAPKILLNAAGAATFGSNVKIGGTPSSPNINLKPNGLAQFGDPGAPSGGDRWGSLLSFRGADSGKTLAGTIVVYSQTNADKTESAIKVVDGSTEKFLVSHDGSAEFASDVKIGGTLPASPNISLNADGSGSMAKGLSVSTALGNNKRFAVSGTTGNVYVGQTAAFLDAGVVLSPDGHGLFRNDVKIGGTLPASPNISLNADGSGTFTGAVTSDNEVVAARLRVDGSLATIGDWYSLVQNTSGNIIGGWTNVDDSFKIGGTLPATPNISLKADGSATFVGKVDSKGLRGWSYGGTYHYELLAATGTSGAVEAFSALTLRQTGTGVQANREAFTAESGGTKNAKINFDGSATFAGTVTATVVPPSDQKFKENITPANPQLADVVALGRQLKNFDWNDDAPLNDELRNVRQLGLIAQEAEKVSPGIVKTIKRTKQGKMLTKGKTIPAVIEPGKTIPAEYRKEKTKKGGFEEVLVTPEQIIPERIITPEHVIEPTYEIVDDSFKGISHDALIMKLLGAVAELSAEVEALKAAKARG